MRSSASIRCGAVLLLGLLACHRAAGDDDEEDKPAAAAVTCQPVEAATVADTVEVNGVIAAPPKLDAVVSSPVAGRVAQVTVDVGDHVAAGQVIAMIEDPALPAGSLEANAAVVSARAQKLAADQEVARQERLVTAGIGARKDLDDARAKQAAAAAEVSASAARSGLAGAQLARREIRAPRAGVVLNLQRKVGESVDGTAATPIAEIADLSVLELHAQVPPAALAPLRDGMSATVHVVGSNVPIKGTIARVAPAVDPASMLGMVRIQLASTDNVKVGVAATAEISIAERPGLRVPASALRRSLTGEDEVVVCAGSAASVRKVTVGNRGSAVELKDGVKPGESVVVDHVLGLQDGQPLEKAGAEKPEKAKEPAEKSK